MNRRVDLVSVVASAFVAEPDAAWMVDAACADRPELRWITDTADLVDGEADVMAAVCATCPVRAACLAYVRASGVAGGTWAGRDRDPHAPTSEPAAGDPAFAQLSLPGLDELTPVTRRSRRDSKRRRGVLQDELPGLAAGGAA